MMAREDLVDSIQHRLDKGHHILPIREFLLNHHPAKDVHEAIDAVYQHALREEGEQQEKDAFRKSLFTPTPGKMILPLLIIIALFLHFLGNAWLLPALSSDLCSIAKSQEGIKEQLASQELTDEESLGLSALARVELAQNIALASSVQNILTFNYPFILLGLSYPDPLFPAACATQLIVPSLNCKYYMPKEDYDCIAGQTIPFIDQTKPYRRISPIEIFLNAFFLIGLGYVINCWFIHILQKKKGEHHVRIIIAISFIILISFVILFYIYLLRTIGARL